MPPMSYLPGNLYTTTYDYPLCCILLLHCTAPVKMGQIINLTCLGLIKDVKILLVAPVETRVDPGKYKLCRVNHKVPDHLSKASLKLTNIIKTEKATMLQKPIIYYGSLTGACHFFQKQYKNAPTISFKIKCTVFSWLQLKRVVSFIVFLQNEQLLFTASIKPNFSQ